MTQVETESIKIVVKVDAPRVRTEKLTAFRAENKTFLISCAPIFSDINFFDYVAAEEDEYGELVFTKIVKSGGYSKYCIIGKKENIDTLRKEKIIIEDVSNILGSNIYYMMLSKEDSRKEVLKKLVSNKVYSPMLAKEVITDIQEDIPDVRLEYHTRGAKKLVKPEKVMEKYIFGKDKRD